MRRIAKLAAACVALTVMSAASAQSLHAGAAKADITAAADISGLPCGDELPDAVAAALRLPRDRVFMSSTHNHNSPTVGADSPGEARMQLVPVTNYFAVLKAGILKAARASDATPTLVRIGYGTGEGYVSTNRDEKIGES